MLLFVLHHLLSIASSFHMDSGFRHNFYRRFLKMKLDAHDDTIISSVPSSSTSPTSLSQSRRKALFSITSLALILPVATLAQEEPLEGISFGEGRWVPMKENAISENISSRSSTAAFCTYATRFLIQYDAGIHQWWLDLEQKYSLLAPEQRHEQCQKQFSLLAKSVQNSLKQEDFSKLWDQLYHAYASDNAEAERQLLILFALLPAELQPIQQMQGVYNDRQWLPIFSTLSEDQMRKDLQNNFRLILPTDSVRVIRQQQQQQSGGKTSFAIHPLTLLEESQSPHQTMTAFGPISTTSPLSRGNPTYGWETYALFGLSGASGCALTHALVIPLDVVKTRSQTDPEGTKSLISSAQRIWKSQGWQGFLMGSQATIAGYFWYGLSVYPSYAFFKRFLGQQMLSPEVAAVHINDIALVAGAIASVIASLGLTPLEAARIRVVANPATYQAVGLSGTLQAIASEGGDLGWKNLYAGLPSLMTRQVIFGSVKFLAFERACETIYNAAPFLEETTWTALTVSLVAGAFSGTISSIVSQPADSVLTYVAKNSENNGVGIGVIEGCKRMVECEGWSSLFRGLGSRCVWAGSIIAGQFMLYDVFRAYFHVTGDDLSQVFTIVLTQ